MNHCRLTAFICLLFAVFGAAVRVDLHTSEYASILTTITSSFGPADCTVTSMPVQEDQMGLIHKAPSWDVLVAPGAVLTSLMVDPDTAKDGEVFMIAPYDGGPANWTDVGTPDRLAATWNNRTRALPLSSGTHFLMSRPDLLVAHGIAQPRTLAELVTSATALDAALPSDVKAICLPTVGSAVGHYLLDFTLSYLQTNGASHGALMSTEDMGPRVTNAGFRRGLTQYGVLARLGPVGRTDEECHDAFIAGECVFTVGTLDVFLRAAAEAGSVSQTIPTPMPGTSTVYHNGALQPCTPDICPLGVDVNGTRVNTVAYTDGGWGVVQAWAGLPTQLAEFVTAPTRTSPHIGQGGLLPTRLTQVDPTLYPTLTPAQYAVMGAALTSTMTHPNPAVPPRPIAAGRYLAALGTVAADVAGGGDVDAATITLHDEWSTITADVGHRVALKAYRMSINAEPYTYIWLSPGWIVLSTVLFVGMLVAALVCIVIVVLLRRNGNFAIASPAYTVAFIGTLPVLSLAFMLSNLNFLIQSTVACNVYLLSFFAGYFTLYGIIFVKQLRLFLVVWATKRRKRGFRPPTDMQLLPVAIVVPLPMTVITIIFLTLGGGIFASTSHGSFDTTILCFMPNAQYFLGIMIINCCVVVFPCLFVAYYTRHFPLEETRVSNFIAVVNAIMVIAAMVIMGYGKWTYRHHINPIVLPTLVNAMAFISLIAVMGPKLYRVARHRVISRRDFLILSGRGYNGLDGFIRCPRCAKVSTIAGHTVSRAEAIADRSRGDDPMVSHVPPPPRPVSPPAPVRGLHACPLTSDVHSGDTDESYSVVTETTKDVWGSSDGMVQEP